MNIGSALLRFNILKSDDFCASLMIWTRLVNKVLPFTLTPILHGQKIPHASERVIFFYIDGIYDIFFHFS